MIRLSRRVRAVARRSTHLTAACVTASVLLATVPPSVASAAPPVVGGTSTFAYLEADPALPIGEQITIANGVAYAGEYLEFSVASATSSETLSLQPDTTPATGNGVVTIVGDRVYLGNGSIAENIGVVDTVRNGAGGQPLRVNFTNAFENPGFETGDLASWTAINNRIDLGVSSIASCATVDTATYAGNTPNRDNNVPSNPGTYTTTVDTTQHSAGAYSLRLLSTGITTQAGFDVVHGPAVFSSPFQAAQGDTIYFDWRAQSGSDAEHVFGYIVNTATCAQTEVLDHVGQSDTGSTPWATVSTVIPQTGTYRFVFVSGTYDFTGGQAAGASLYIDNVRVYGTKATDDVAQQVARRIRYYNGSFDVPATRTVNLLARNSAGEQGTSTITVELTPLDEAPVYLDDVLGAIRHSVAYSDAVTTRAWPFADYSIAGTLPTGLTFDPTTATLTGSATVPNETYDFTIAATNRAGTTTRTYTGTVRTAPLTFTDADTGQFLVGQAHNNGVLADGTPAPTYSVVSGNLPAGLNLNPTTGVITGTPTTAGPYTFTVRATNIEGSLEQTFTGNVYRTPSFTDDALATFVTGATYSDGVSAAGLPSPTYSITAGALPVGLSLDPNTGAITGTPTAPEAPYSFTISATNVAGVATRSYSGTVNTIPRSFTDATLSQPYVGQPYVDGVAANGFPAPAYSVVAGALPTGLTLDPATGAITGTPTSGGAYDVTIAATNSVGALTQRLVGNVFGLPAFADDQISLFVAGVPFSDGVFAIGTPTPTYAVSAGALPAGISLDATTGALTGTPTTPEAAYAFTITATNVAGTDSRSFTGNVASAPTEFTDDNIGQPVVGRLLVDGVSANGMQTPTYTVTSGTLPAGLSLDPNTGAITGTPSTAGPYSFWVTASNPQGSIAIPVRGTVATELVATDSTVGAIHVGVPFTDGVTATGFPAPTYAVTAGALPAGLTLDPNTGAITGTPTEADAAYSFTITATNLAGSVTFSSSGNVNAAPRGFPDSDIGQPTAGTPLTETVAANGFPAPTYEVTTGELPDGLTLDPVTGTITGTPTTGGPYSFEITATNGSGSSTQAFSGVIHSLPVVTDSTLAEPRYGVEYGDAVAAIGWPAPTYAVVDGELPDGLVLDESTGTITGSPSAPDAAYAFTIRATNVVGAVDFVFSGTVTTAPLAFLQSELEPMALGETFQQTLLASGFPAPAYEVTGGALPDGLVLDPVTGEISGTPTTGGPYSFQVTATNAEGAFSATFTGGVVHGPSVVDGQLAPFRHGGDYSDAVVISGWPAPTFTVSAGALPAGLSLDATTGTIRGVPSEPNQPYSFTLTATNEAGSVDLEYSGIIRTAPAAPDHADLGALTAGTPLVTTVAVAGYPAPTYAVTAGSLPPGLTLDPATGAITGTPTNGGPYTVTVTASNLDGNTPITLTGIIASVPAVADGVIAAPVAGQPYTDGVQATGWPAVTYAVTAGNLPTGLSLDPTTGAITGVPTTAGPYRFTITATTTAGSVDIVVEGAVNAVPNAPDAAALGPIVAGKPVSVSVATGGYPASTYAISAGGLPEGLTLDPTTGRITGTPTRPGPYSFTVTATNAAGTVSTTFTGLVNPADGGFLGLTPARAVDTRAGAPLPAGTVFELDVRGRFGVPADSRAVALNVTVTEPDARGFVTVFPCGSPQPDASNLNFEAGQTASNGVTAMIGDDGKVCLYLTASANLVVDVNGAYSPTEGFGQLQPLTPHRLFDSRDGGVPAAADSVTRVPVLGRDGVPATATAVVLNVTATQPTAAGYLTVYPCDVARPEASNVNFAVGETVPNSVTAAIASTGDICVYSDAETHLIVDINAVYAKDAFGYFQSTNPVRLLDTRTGPRPNAGDIQMIDIDDHPALAGAVAAVLNVTIDDPDTPGFATVFPCAAGLPLASNVNFVEGQTVPNAALSAIDDNGQICIYVNAASHVIVDLNAIYTS